MDYSGLSIPKFSLSVGFKTPQTIREILKGNTKTLSDAVFFKITSRYPEINKQWLRTGEGEMVRGNVTLTSHGDNSPNINGSGNRLAPAAAPSEMALLDELSEMRKLIQEQVRNNQEQFDRLMSVIEQLTSKL